MLSEEPVADAASSASSAGEDSPPAGRRETYIAAALRDEAVRLVDFVPMNYLAIAGLVLSGGLLIGGLAAAHAWLPEIGDWGGGDVARVFDLALRGGLATWFSSTLWSLTSFGCLVVFSMRRHRLDDIRGRYRIWLPMAGVCLCLSMDAVVDCRRLGLAAAAPLAPWCNAEPGMIWGVTAGVLLGALVLRLGFELRGARLALGLMAAGASLLAAAIIAPHGMSVTAGSRQALWLACAWLTGQMLLFLAISLYGRHVLLDASGLLKPRAAKPKRTRKVKPAPDSSADDAKETLQNARSALAASPLRTRIDAAQSPQPHLSDRSASSPRVAVAASARAQDADDDEEDDDESFQGLSRADRKKLRRQQRRAERDR